MSLTNVDVNIDIFDAINQNNLDVVEGYISEGKDLAVKNAKGITLIAAAALNLVATERRTEASFEDWDDIDDDDFADDPDLTQRPLDFADALSENMRTATEIGKSLILAGLPLHARIGRTDRSISCKDFVQSRYPEVFKDWLAADQRRKITVLVEEEVDMEAKPVAGPRKI